MAEKKLSSLDYIKYWEAERKMLLEATATALPKILMEWGWEILEVKKVPYQVNGEKKFRSETTEILPGTFTNSHPNLQGRTFKAKKKVRGDNQLVSLQMAKNNFMLWVDYSRNPKLEITQPRREEYLLTMKGEQQFMKERLHHYNDQDQEKLSKLIQHPVKLDSLASDYEILEPLRKLAIRDFKEEFSRMLDFNLNIKLRYCIKNPELGQTEKPGGSLISLLKPSYETTQLRILELAKEKPSPEILQWLNRRENIDVSAVMRILAKKYNPELAHKFYDSRPEMTQAVSRKENEITLGMDTQFKATTTCQDVASQYGFRYQRTTSEREYYCREGNGKEAKSIIISMPKANPYVYKNHSSPEMKGGNIQTFRKEFEQFKPKENESQVLREMNALGGSGNISIDNEMLRTEPEQPIAGTQVEMELDFIKRK